MPPQQEEPIALAMADEGQPLCIFALRAGRGLDRRLTELGLNIGTELRIVDRQGGGLLVARGNTRFAVGGGMAMKIMVVRILLSPPSGTDQMREKT